MSAKAVHLNLLQPSERMSSSPVRVRIILPVVFGLFMAAMLLWWGFLLVQQRMASAEVQELKREIAASERAYAEVSRIKGELRAKEAELNQLRGFMSARRTWGETLAAIAERLPESVQLTSIEIPEPPPQNLKPPPGVKQPPLPGPTGTVERVTFRIAGRTAKEENLFAFLKAVKSSAVCTSNLVVADGDAQNPSPRMRQFGQDSTTGEDGNRAIVFDVEYRTPGRRFAP